MTLNFQLLGIYPKEMPKQDSKLPHQTAYPHEIISPIKPGSIPILFSNVHKQSYSSVWHTQKTLVSMYWVKALKYATMFSGGCLLNYMGHSYPCSLCSLLLAFSSRFKWSFPFSESLSHSHILYVWNNLQTFHKVRVWGKIDMLAKLLTKLKHFVIFSIRRDKMIPFWKGWCSKQTRELLSITNVIPCIMGSIVCLWESFQFIGFEYHTFSTNS